MYIESLLVIFPNHEFTIEDNYGRIIENIKEIVKTFKFELNGHQIELVDANPRNCKIETEYNPQCHGTNGCIEGCIEIENVKYTVDGEEESDLSISGIEYHQAFGDYLAIEIIINKDEEDYDYESVSSQDLEQISDKINELAYN